MPSYVHLTEQKLNFKAVRDRVWAASLLGAKYDFDLDDSERVARQQADEVAGVLVQQGGPANIQDTKVIALIAYMQRLGTDLSRPDDADGDDSSEDTAQVNQPAYEKPTSLSSQEIPAHSKPNSEQASLSPVTESNQG